MAPDEPPDEQIDALNATGIAVIGTPEMAVAQIERLQKQSGGFGTYLFMAHDWADRPATLQSYELFAQYVIPRFQGQLDRAERSRDWAAANRPEFIGAAAQAVVGAIKSHYAEKKADPGGGRTG